MKKFLIIALLLIPFTGFSQTTKPIDGFLGIKFGASKAAVIAAIKAKGGVISKDVVGVNEVIQFTKVNLGHRPTILFTVKFVNNKAFEADFYFNPGLEAKTIEYYNDLANDINDIYGQGNFEKNFKDPYKDGDGNETTAISSGNADYTTLWENTESKNSISLKIMPDLLVKLSYQNDALIDEAIAKQKASEKADF